MTLPSSSQGPSASPPPRPRYLPLTDRAPPGSPRSSFRASCSTFARSVRRTRARTRCSARTRRSSHPNPRASCSPLPFSATSASSLSSRMETWILTWTWTLTCVGRMEGVRKMEWVGVEMRQCRGGGGEGTRRRLRQANDLRCIRLFERMLCTCIVTVWKNDLLLALPCRSSGPVCTRRQQ